MQRRDFISGGAGLILGAGGTYLALKDSKKNPMR